MDRILTVVVEKNKPFLKIDWATHEAAKYACENWHYSKSMPVGKLVKVGAWEDGKFIGVVLFSRGANNNLLSPYGLSQKEGCELTRIALNTHKNPVSKILSISFRFLKKNSKNLRLVVSYADTNAGHHGGVYQANGWIYVGSIRQASTAVLNGKIAHKRTFDSAGIKGYNLIPAKPKHKYLMPLDEEMRKQILPLSKPYPKRVLSADNGTGGDQSQGGGVIPTNTLQNYEAS